MNFEEVNNFDQKLLNDVLADEKYEWIRSYDVHIKMFYKYGKYDKDGNLKSPALVKNGIAIPMAIRIVSSFNRLTDDVDVKIIINKELWEQLSSDQKKATLDGTLYYLELKTDKVGEPLPISQENDKVQLKLKHPDFYCEGFNCMAESYGSHYLPIQDAESIAKLLVNHFEKSVEKDDKVTEVKMSEQKPIKKQKKQKKEQKIEQESVEISDDVNLDDIKL